mgnify:CR=1 FL=1|jgi:hypothetical protein
MAYTQNMNLALGSSKTGLTLVAQLVTSAGADTGSTITTGFSEIGGGNYLWNYDSFSDDFRGGVKFYESGVPGTILAFTGVNPQESENPDIKTSEVQASITNNTIMSVDALKDALLS